MGKGFTLFTIFIISLAGLAILFQTIGLGVTAWKKFHVSGNMKQFMSDSPSFALGARAGLNMMNMMDGQSLLDGAGGSGTANGMPGIGDILGSNSDGSSNANGMGNLGNMVDPTVSKNITPIYHSLYRDMFLNTQVSFDIDQGLWKSSISGCVNVMEIKMCVSIESMPAKYTKDILVDFTTEKALCVFGIIAAVVGTILLVVLLASTVDTPMTVLAFCCVAAWIVSALLGFIAAGLGANINDNKNLEMVAKMMTNSEAHFVCPWAIVMTGFGAFFALIVGVIVVQRARQPRNNTKLPGTWNQFKNVPVYRDEA